MTLRLSVCAMVWLAGFGIAVAQQAPAADPQGHDPNKSQQGGKEEPGSHSAGASTSTDIFVNGKLAVPGAPQDSQTVPAKFSTRNAWLDAQPIMALPLGITDEQVRRVTDAVKDTPTTDKISAKVADILPATTPTSELPADVKAAIPMISDLHYIHLKDKILLVRAPNMIVVGELATQ